MRRIPSTFAGLALALFGLASCDSGSSTSPGTGGVSAPSFSPAGGTFSSAQSVTLTSSTSGTAIFYSTDGATPTITSTLYVQPISVTSSETIKAIAIGAGAVSSSVSSATYTIQTGGSSNSPLVGTWKEISSDTSDGYRNIDTVTLVFVANGASFTLTDHYRYTEISSGQADVGVVTGTGTWSVSGNNLTTTATIDGETSTSTKTFSISGNKLTTVDNSNGTTETDIFTKQP